MADKNELIRQTHLAFDFIQKLYFEVSYLIKEIEGTLFEEDEKFIICRTGGYGVAARGSTGLESVYVNLWLMRKLAVAFIPESMTNQEKGQTFTEINDTLKVFYVRIVLNDKDYSEPQIEAGYFINFEVRQAGKSRIKRFENLMSHIIYNEQKVFNTPEAVYYEDAYIKLEGKFINVNLYDLTDSKALHDKLVLPALELYRSLAII